MNQNSELINQDSSLGWNKTSTQQQTNSETLEQQKSNSWTPVGPTNRSSGPSQINCNKSVIIIPPIGPRQANLVILAYASSEGSGEPAHPPEPSLIAHTSSESRGTFRQKARSLAPLNGWACAVEICHDGMLEDTNSLDGAQFMYFFQYFDASYKHPLSNFRILLKGKRSCEWYSYPYIKLHSSGNTFHY